MFFLTAVSRFCTTFTPPWLSTKLVTRPLWGASDIKVRCRGKKLWRIRQTLLPGNLQPYQLCQLYECNLMGSMGSRSWGHDSPGCLIKMRFREKYIQALDSRSVYFQGIIDTFEIYRCPTSWRLILLTSCVSRPRDIKSVDEIIFTWNTTC